MTDSDSIAQSSYCLAHISDADLLTSTRHLVGRSNQLLASLLAHLAEVEARGIHRLRACASLYTYCVYELRLSEDAAFRRARAAKLARRFPVIFQQVADGELHLSALMMLGPHLTEGNHLELLALAKHRTKREVLHLIRTLAPEPNVVDRIEPLGPGPLALPVPRAPSWRQFVDSFGPAVRELAPGDRPKDWAALPHTSAESESESTSTLKTEGVVTNGDPEASSWTPPQRYQVQFTASQEYVDLLEQARDLLSHAVPNRSIAEVHLRAMRLLVEQLQKRKYGAPHARALDTAPTTPQPLAGKNHARVPRRRGSASVRREVWDRDGGRCTFQNETGQRCQETRFLELHHEHAHALGGSAEASNLTLRCRAHNALAAEQDFGREFIAERKAIG